MASLDVHDYYEQLTGQDIAQVAKELMPGRVAEEGEAATLFDCPVHESQSKKSLRVSPHEGLWHCFGCGVGGDVLQLVEFVQTGGTVTKGTKGEMPASHRAARDYLADRIGLPALGRSGYTAAELDRLEKKKAEGERVFAAMTSAAERYHLDLLSAPEVIKWTKGKYGLTTETLARLKVGWADRADLFDLLEREGHPPRAISGTGLFHFDSHENPWPFFGKRLVIPYWSRGRAVYMIGRRTPWSSDAQYDQAKYRKLPVHNESSRRYVSPAIDNSILFGEDVLLSRPERVILTEGVTDAIAAQQAGFACVSPVTVRFKKADVARVAQSLKGGGTTVYLCQDNELSGVGLAGALDTAEVLGAQGVNCLIATIPLMEAQEKARAEFEALLGPEVLREWRSAEPAKRGRLLKDRLTEGAVETARALAEAGKVDLCEWLRGNGTPTDLERILGEARDAIEVSVDAARVEEEDRDTVRGMAELLTRVGLMRKTEADHYLRRIKERTGIGIGTLRDEAKAFAREFRKERKELAARDAVVAQIPDEPGTFRKEVAEAIINAAANKLPISWEALGEEFYEWLVERGAQFFRNRQGQPALFWENDLWPISPREEGPRRRYEGLMYRLTGLVPTSIGPRTFFSVIAGLAADRGKLRDAFSWSHSDVDACTLWFNLNNEDQEIAKVTPKGVEILPNGTNEDGIILRGHEKVRPIQYDPDADPAELQGALEELVVENLACRPLQRAPLVDWLLCFPILEFSGTRPAARLEGDPGSGKTWGAKMLTTLVYGEAEQKKATEAANYVDGARNPLVALDNVETKNTTPGLIDFFLTGVTGISREKRAGGTDEGTTVERPMCLILSTGVEPLGGELEEVMSRTLVFEFDARYQSDALLEKRILSRIQKKRDWFISAILNQTAVVLWLIEQDGHARAMAAIRRSLGSHGKRRCDEYFALMYLHRVARAPEDQREALLDELDPDFGRIVKAMGETTQRISRDASPVVTAVVGLFVGLREDQTERYGLAVSEDRDQIFQVTPTLLFTALRTMSRNRGINCPWDNAVQFGRRFSASVHHLNEQGIDVDWKWNGHRTRLYSLTWNRRQGALSVEGADEEARRVDAAIRETETLRREVDRIARARTQDGFSGDPDLEDFYAS